jgi:hypothetical protein
MENTTSICLKKIFRGKKKDLEVWFTSLALEIKPLK